MSILASRPRPYPRWRPRAPTWRSRISRAGSRQTKQTSLTWLVSAVRLPAARDRPVAARLEPYGPREPRPSTVRRLYEYHATLDALRRRLGESAMQRWLELGRRETLLAGNLEALGDDLRQALFSPAQRWFDLAAAPEPTDDIPVRSRSQRRRTALRVQPRRATGR